MIAGNFEKSATETLQSSKLENFAKFVREFSSLFCLADLPYS